MEVKRKGPKRGRGKRKGGGTKMIEKIGKGERNTIRTGRKTTQRKEKLTKSA